MNNKIKTIVIVILFTIFIGGAYVAYNQLSDNYKPDNQLNIIKNSPTANNNTDSTSSPDVKESLVPDIAKNKAPDFTVFDAKGNEVRLSDFSGKPVVINFWASWCPPCKGEMPDFNEVYLNLDEDVVFMMIDLTDGGRETQDSGQQYVEEQDFEFPVYFDLNQDAGYTYSISSIPTTFFVDSDGNIAGNYVGGIDKETLLSGIDLITK